MKYFPLAVIIACPFSVLLTNVVYDETTIMGLLLLSLKFILLPMFIFWFLFIEKPYAKRYHILTGEVLTEWSIPNPTGLKFYAITVGLAIFMAIMGAGMTFFPLAILNAQVGPQHETTKSLLLVGKQNCVRKGTTPCQRYLLLENGRGSEVKFKVDISDFEKTEIGKTYNLYYNTGFLNLTYLNKEKSSF